MKKIMNQDTKSEEQRANNHPHADLKEKQIKAGLQASGAGPSPFMSRLYDQ